MSLFCILGNFHVSFWNRLLHLATTKLAVVLYFGYTVNTFWFDSGRLPVKLNYDECQHITISFSKHKPQFLRQTAICHVLALFIFNPKSWIYPLLVKKKKTVSRTPLVLKTAEFVLVSEKDLCETALYSYNSWGKVVPFPRTRNRGDSRNMIPPILSVFLCVCLSRGDWLLWSCTCFKATANHQLLLHGDI